MAIKKPTLPFITGGNTDVNNPDGGNLSNKTKYVFTFLPGIPLLEIYLEDISSNIYTKTDMPMFIHGSINCNVLSVNLQ